MYSATERFVADGSATVCCYAMVCCKQKIAKKKKKKIASLIYVGYSELQCT